MYLSRLALNPCSAQVRSELARPYEMHRTLSHAFEHGAFEVSRAAAESSGVLFRVDENPRDNTIGVLVQSRIAPDWSRLTAQMDLRGQPYLMRLAEVKPINLQLTAGQVLSFRLRANPTKRLPPQDGRDGKRVGLYQEEEQLAWLKRKAEAGGFRLVRAQLSRDEKITGEIHQSNQDHDLKLFTVQFDGVLQIADPEQALHTIESGIGSGKGFGCGLLSLARAA
jgi:CRISPR system Cascade subunit CasE